MPEIRLQRGGDRGVGVELGGLYVGGVVEPEAVSGRLDGVSNLGVGGEVERDDDVGVGSVGGDLGGELAWGWWQTLDLDGDAALGEDQHQVGVVARHGVIESGAEWGAV